MTFVTKSAFALGVRVARDLGASSKLLSLFLPVVEGCLGLGVGLRLRRGLQFRLGLGLGGMRVLAAISKLAAAGVLEGDVRTSVALFSWMS